MVLSLADRQNDWVDAHNVFDIVRDETLKLLAVVQRTTIQDLQLAVLSLAELVAQVLYNSTDPEDEFDEDTGWWIVACAKHIVNQIGNSGFESDVWSELVRNRSE
jgi:hypothetical protein